MPLVFALLLAALVPTATTAQEAAAPRDRVVDGASRASNGATRASDEGRVAVPPPTEKALRYYRTGIPVWLFDIAWGLAVPVLFLFTGFSARLRSLAKRLGRRWFFTVALYLVLFLLVSFVVDLPVAYYEGFVREHAYGLSNQTLGKWIGDAVKGLAVGIVLCVVFGWVPFLFLKMSPRRWWLYTALLSVPFLCLMLLIGPLWIAPLFNHFGPMKDKALETRILALAARSGIEGGRVYEVDKSVDTKAVNAYVTGLFGSKRIVLWDTLLGRLDDRQVLAVMGHEMGHYVLGHVRTMIALNALVVFVTLYLAHRTAGGLIRRYAGRFGFDHLHDVASLPLLILLANVFSLVVSPVVLGYSRHIEHEADRFALELTHDNRAVAGAFVKLQEENLAVPRPHPLLVLFRSSHPPLGQRIDFANDYRPWESGARPRYGSYIRDVP